MNDKNKTFLICHRGALGDFILAWPALFLLKKHFPEYRFVGIGRPDYMKLAIKLGIVEQYHDAESSGMLDFFENGILPERLRTPDKGALWLKDAGKTAGLLKRNSNCDFAPIEPFPNGKIHVAEYHVREISKYYRIADGVFNFSTLLPRFSFPPKNIILIHPGSGSLKKNYSPEFYRKLAELAETHFQKDVKFILGPVEIERDTGRHFPVDKTILPVSASELADVLGGAYLYIGNDSGASHLSGILGTPTLAFYKNTAPEKWGVIGRKVKCDVGTDEKQILEKMIKFFFSGNIFQHFMSN